MEAEAMLAMEVAPAEELQGRGRAKEPSEVEETGWAETGEATE